MQSEHIGKVTNCKKCGDLFQICEAPGYISLDDAAEQNLQNTDSKTFENKESEINWSAIFMWVEFVIMSIAIILNSLVNE